MYLFIYLLYFVFATSYVFMNFLSFFNEYSYVFRSKKIQNIFYCCYSIVGQKMTLFLSCQYMYSMSIAYCNNLLHPFLFVSLNYFVTEWNGLKWWKHKFFRVISFIRGIVHNACGKLLHSNEVIFIVPSEKNICLYEMNAGTVFMNRCNRKWNKVCHMYSIIFLSSEEDKNSYFLLSIVI